MKEEGKVGFDDKPKPPKEEILTKEESMFNVGPDGKAIPEIYQIELYDRDLDVELMEEALQLSQALKQRDAVRNVLADLNKRQEQEITKLKTKIDQCTDDKEKKKLRNDLVSMQQTTQMEEVKQMVNSEMLSESIKESQYIIREINKKIAETKQIKNIEIIPCNITEAYLAFEQGKSVEGKVVEDWVADLIVKHVTTPKYTLEEVKLMRRDYKIAIKEAIMKVSNYKTKNYKDILVEESLKGTLREKK